MLTVETFTKYVMKNFLSFLPAEYKDCKLTIRKVPKVNEVLTGVILVPKSKGSYTSPTFYIERMYEQYTQSGDLEGTMRKQAQYLKEAMARLPDCVNENMIPGASVDKIIFQVINASANAEMLAICPHRNFGSVAAVYRAIVELDETGVSGFLVTNDIAKSEGWTEEYLYELAKKNTPREFPFTTERIEETMARIMRRNYMLPCQADPVAIFGEEYNEVPADERVYIISNKYEFFGANVVMFPEEIRKVAEMIGTDVYVLPSSVHDVIVISVNAFDNSGRLLNLVKETNASHVRPQERLADMMWKYSLETGELTEVIEVVEEEREGA